MSKSHNHFLRKLKYLAEPDQHIDEDVPTDVLGLSLLAYSVFPIRYPTYGKVWICERGIVFSGFQGLVVIPYSGVESVKILLADDLPKVMLWGMRYWMIDFVTFKLVGGGEVQIPHALPGHCMRNSGIFEMLCRFATEQNQDQ